MECREGDGRKRLPILKCFIWMVMKGVCTVWGIGLSADTSEKKLCDCIGNDVECIHLVIVWFMVTLGHQWQELEMPYHGSRSSGVVE